MVEGMLALLIHNGRLTAGFSGFLNHRLDAVLLHNFDSLIYLALIRRMREPAQQQREAAARQRSRTEAGIKRSGGRKSPIGSIKNLSVIRAFAILKAFYYPDEWVATSELSRRTKIHEATLNRFMQSLMDVGAVVRDERAKYRCVLIAMPGMQSRESQTGTSVGG
jgi:hypothetical protein